MPRGRTRTFDTDAALDRALDLFSRQGYEGTSIAQLTAAMGITPPQLYLAFGSKRQLFDAVIERYGEVRRPDMDDTIAQPTARLVAERFLRGSAEHDTLPDAPRGCLTVQGCLTASPDDRHAADALARARATNQAAIRERFDRSVADGDLPAGTNTEALARFVSTVSQGISVQASGGASREELEDVVTLALDAIPTLTASDA